jgi:putative ABC transport system substrate-binding protein
MQRRTFLGGSAAILAALLLPPDAFAEQPTKLPVIGFLSGVSPGPYAPYVAAFRQGLKEAGYVEGQNVAIEYRWAEGRYDRLPELAGDLVGRKVDVIAATGGGPATVRAAKHATSTIPIVFVTGTDPVEDGLIASLARPGGNVTGVSMMFVEMTPKRLELLSDLVPKIKAIALLVNPKNANAERVMRDMQEAVRAKGMQLHIAKAGSEKEIETAYAGLVQLRVGGLVVANDAFFTSRRAQLTALAARHVVPAIYEGREFVDAGGLISYGTNLIAVYHQLGDYAGRILKGTKPADLPVQQPTKFELVINLKAAMALGLTVPPAILDLADEVIE